MNTFDLSHINQSVLNKQHLAEYLEPDDVVKIVRDIGGLHATNPTAPYLSLFSRTKNFTIDRLNEELYNKRNLAKIRCWRKTVYILPTDLVAVAYAATKKMIELNSKHYAQFLGVTAKQYKETSKRIMKILKGKALSTREIKQELKTKLNVSPIVNLMCDQGLLVRGRPKGGWKSNIHTYNILTEYFPDVDLNSVDAEEARKLIVKHYFAAFGPATENDVAWWTGFSKSQIKSTLLSFQSEITHVEISDLEGSYLMLASDGKALKSTNIAKKVVNLLPSLDPYLMGYKDRERYMPKKKYYNNVFDRSGNATSTILLDGRVIGVWDFIEDAKSIIKLFFFEEVEKDVYEEACSEAKRIGIFMAKKFQIKKCEAMIPLTSRTAGGVMSPLKDS